MKKILNLYFAASLCAFLSVAITDTWSQTMPCMAPTDLIGEVNPCTSATSGFNYSVQGLPMGPGMYAVWEIPEGGYNILSSDLFNYNRTIQWTTPGTKTIKVYRNGCNTLFKTLVVNVGAGNLDIPSTITGSKSVCVNATGVYSVVSGTANFVWILKTSTGAVDIDNPLTKSGNSISIQWLKAGVYTLEVYQDNGTCRSPSRTMLIEVGPPGRSSVNTSVSPQCTGAATSFSSYSSTDYSYSWSVIPSTAGSVTWSGANASVTWGNTPGDYTVQLITTNTCGSSTNTKLVTVVASPAPPTLSASATFVSTGQNVTLSISNFSSSNSYLFEPSGSYSLSLTPSGVLFSTNIPAIYPLAVRQMAGTCISPPSNTINITAMNPSIGPSVSGPTETCINVPGSYTVNYPLTTYVWRVAPGAAKLNGVVASTNTITTGSTVTVEWLQGGAQTLQVFPLYVPSGYTLKSTVFNVRVHQPLDATKVSEIVGSNSVCLMGSAQSPSSVRFPYSIRYNDNISPLDASNFKTTWTVTGGGTVATNSDPSSATVSWTTPGNFVLTANVSNTCPGAPTIVKTLNVSTANYSSAAPKPVSTPSSLLVLSPFDFMVANADPSANYKWQTSGRIITQAYDHSVMDFNTPNGSHYVSYLYNTGVCDVMPVLVNFPVTRRAQVISLGGVSNLVAGDIVTLNATSTNPGVPITFRSSDPTIASVSGNQLTCLTAGTVTIYASQEGTATYNPADDVFMTVTISKRSQTITFTPITASCAGNKITLAATTTSGLPITYQSSNTAVATIAGNVVTAVSAGTANITATQSGDASYNAATPVIQSLAVNALPALTSSVTFTQCDDLTTNIPLTSSIANSTFAWTIGPVTNATGASAGSGNSISQKLSLMNKTTAGSAAYSVTVTSPTGCVSTATLVSVQINPNPQVTNSNKSICSGKSTGLTLTSTIATSTFNWSLKAQVDVTGASGPGTTSSINQILTATSTVAGTATYTVTPTKNGCNGNPKDITITVKPLPLVTGNDAAICSGQSPKIQLSSIAGSTISWTASPTNVTGSSAGNGTIIDQILSTVTGGTVTYSITAVANGCTGPVKTVMATVNPLASVIAADKTICAGQSTDIDLASNLAGASFSWIVKSATNVTGATTGNGIVIPQILSVTTGAEGTVVYTVSPLPPGTACAGPSRDVTVTVKATPQATGNDISICSGQSTGILLTSSVAGTNLNWTASSTNVTGAADGNGALIDQTLTTSAGGNVVYTVTPSLNGCTGAVKVINATVNAVANAFGNDQAICSGGSTSINLSSNLTGGSFSWFVKSASNVTGAVAGSGGSISQTLTTSTQATGTLVYTVTPLPPGTACSGPAIDINVTVNPAPLVAASNVSICSNTSTAITLTSDPVGANFSWTVASSGVGGAVDGSGNLIDQALTTTSGGTATYSVTPALNGCAGPLKTIIATVKPIADVAADNSTICSGQNTSINLKSNVTATSYLWSVKNVTNVTGATVGSSFTSSQIVQTLTVASQAIGRVIYTVTPVPPSSACAGMPVDVTATVNPLPTLATMQPQTVCSGQSALNVTPTVDVVAATYSWTSSIQGSVTGASPSGTGTIQDLLSNTSAALGTVTYTVVPKYDFCSGPSKTLVVSVKPKMDGYITGNTVICSGNAVTLKAYPAGVSYKWSSGQTSQSITVGTTGTYSVTISGGIYCMSSQPSKTVTSGTSPSPSIIVIANRLCQQVSDPRAQIVTQTADSYLWSTGETSQYIYVSNSGTYSVTVTKGGCSGSTSRFITCGTSGRTTASPERDEILEFQPYPNPADDEVKINVPVGQPYTVSVFNSVGSSVYAPSHYNSEGLLHIDTSELKPGVYILKLIDQQRSFEWKLMINH